MITQTLVWSQLRQPKQSRTFKRQENLPQHIRFSSSWPQKKKKSLPYGHLWILNPTPDNLEKRTHSVFGLLKAPTFRRQQCSKFLREYEVYWSQIRARAAQVSSTKPLQPLALSILNYAPMPSRKYWRSPIFSRRCPMMFLLTYLQSNLEDIRML